jgi:hypothetical protein
MALTFPDISATSLTPTAVKTSAYTAVAGEFVPVDTTSGVVTVTLPTAPADKATVGVKHVVQGSTNTVTVATGGSDVFNKAGGSTSLTLTLLTQGVLLQYQASGGIWYVVADDLPLAQIDGRYVLGTALSSSTPGATAGSGAAGSSTNVSRSDHVHASPQLSATVPAALGAAAAGSATDAAKQDHVHPTTSLELTANKNAASGYLGLNSDSTPGIALGNAQPFTASGTWTKPTNCTLVAVICIGAGGGGGAGARRASGTATSGGAGGTAGGYSFNVFRASDLGSTEAVTVGTGGGGAAAQTTNDSDGANGTAGGFSSFGATRVRSNGGGLGNGGTAGTSTNGGGGRGMVAQATGATGTAGAAGSAASGVGGAGAGGSGGGISTTPGQFGGGAGGNTTQNGDASASAGTSGGGAGGTGTSGSANTPTPGAGGGGGGSNISGAGGAGGNGGTYGGGGGGGGSALNGSNGGAGGNGANGFVLVVSI